MGISKNLQRQGKGSEQTSSCLGHLTVRRGSERGRKACKTSQRILKQTAKYGLNGVEKELPGGSSSSFVQGLLCAAGAVEQNQHYCTDIFPDSIFTTSS